MSSKNILEERPGPSRQEFVEVEAASEVESESAAGDLVSLLSEDDLSVPSDLSVPTDFEISTDVESVSSLENESCVEKEEEETAGLLSVDDEAFDGDSEVEVEETRKRRKKRGAFKKGVLKQRKYARSRSSSSTRSRSHSGSRANEFENIVESELTRELTDYAEDSAGFLSCPSTAPSGLDESEPESDGKEKKVRRVPGRGSKSIGRQKKKKVVVPSGPADRSRVDKPSEKSGESLKSEKSEKLKSPTYEQASSVDAADLFTARIKSLSGLSTSSLEALCAIRDYLRLTLSNDWTVSTSEDILSVCKISGATNPYVERAVTWNGHQVNFFVHNKQVPPKNILWTLKKPDPKNMGGVADYLTSVSKLFLLHEICKGIDSHQDLWEKHADNAYTENYGSPTMRANNCSLLRTYPGRCSKCHSILKSMVKQERRKLLDSDKTKVNYKYLSKEDLITRLAKVQKEKKLSQQQVKRLRKRVKKLLEKNAAYVDKELGGDFIKIMNENVEKMTPIEKLFWEQQSAALKKRDKSKTMRWHPAMIRLALQLRMLSPAAYDFVKGFLTLPSQRRLFDYSQFTDIKEGVQEDLLEQLSSTIEQKCPEEYQQYFNLLHDEMTIRSDLVFNARSGELIGFTNLSSVEEEMASLEAEISGKDHEKKMAKKVLVYMLNGAVSNVRFVAAAYSTDDLSAGQLHSRTWDVIYAVEEAGAKVSAVICDGASVNRKFISMHPNHCNSTNFTFNTVNLTSGEARPLYFMLDPPHLMKTFRNCFANSGSHRLTRNLCINNQEISWKAIEALHDITKDDKFKSVKLTKAHVRLTSFSCMKVQLAVQVFSKSVAAALCQFKDHPSLKEYFNEELVRFIELMNRWFDCFNASKDSKKKAQNPDLQEYTSIDDPRFVFLEKEFLGFLEEWEEYVSRQEGTKEAKAKLIVSFQSLEAIKITVHSFIGITKFLLEKNAPWICARKFNQDPLEQYFADQRRARGSDDNPTVSQFLHSRLSLHSIGQMTSGGKRQNTEDLRSMSAVDDTPVPVRKRVKK